MSSNNSKNREDDYDTKICLLGSSTLHSHQTFHNTKHDSLIGLIYTMLYHSGPGSFSYIPNFPTCFKHCHHGHTLKHFEQQKTV